MYFPRMDGIVYQVWMLGSRCRAVYSEDGLVYPAVLVWMRGERCRVKFEGYGNEEELELSTLLSPDDLGRHCGRATAKVQQGVKLHLNPHLCGLYARRFK